MSAERANSVETPSQFEPIKLLQALLQGKDHLEISGWDKKVVICDDSFLDSTTPDSDKLVILVTAPGNTPLYPFDECYVFIPEEDDSPMWFDKRGERTLMPNYDFSRLEPVHTILFNPIQAKKIAAEIIQSLEEIDPLLYAKALLKDCLAATIQTDEFAISVCDGRASGEKDSEDARKNLVFEIAPSGYFATERYEFNLNGINVFVRGIRSVLGHVISPPLKRHSSWKFAERIKNTEPTYKYITTELSQFTRKAILGQ